MGLEVFVVSTILLFIVLSINISFAFIDGALSLANSNRITFGFKGSLSKNKLDGMDI